MSSTRAGHIPGTHTVGFDGPSETIEFTHAVRDRAVFARGALAAAKWLIGKRGWFSLRDMMATTEQHKIPDTVLSRSQVYEFKTISAKIVADRLRTIAIEEKIDVPDAGLLLLARAGEGSMRDSLSAFDQVRAFAGDAIAVDDVVTVLGLVGRDLVLDMYRSRTAHFDGLAGA